ncbi:conserved hypothetical protein [Beutenbergia cavernae DSM 12333]|uniref:DUF4097 domain-containing protein n=1 Tax=Beutenbergia cavernae (strain ATCC BAA-8 / DSM 12333 / CCUG 43141 / JCM 11478 / NBRC 16432 / NCIMB 13614 / HKI 0122) TaxID=471853 RepID=C5C461_BEUC1|nr:DUF4097 family beta strand repeat-containing protein [Beutenbergia cavernae]ACQ79974.1 conserved hypothetical protein [Beutenbergia cavernae DSM 12333]
MSTNDTQHTGPSEERLSDTRRLHRFDVGAEPRLVAQLGLADVEIDATGPGGHVVVDLETFGSKARDLLERTSVEQDGSTVRIDMPRVSTFFGLSPRMRVRVQVPAGTAVDLGAGSGDVSVRGELGGAHVETGSGGIDLESVHEAEIKAGSGDVRVGRAHGLRIRTGSGGIRIGEVVGDVAATAGSGDMTVGTVRASTSLTCGSGNIDVEDVSGDAQVKTGSGRVRVARATQGQLSVATGSGTIRVGVAEGTAAHLDVSTVSGRVRSELESVPGAGENDRTLMLRARAVSGNIDLVRAV